MLITKLKQCLIILFIMISPYSKTIIGSNIASNEVIPTIELKEVVIKAKKHSHRKSSIFLDYVLQQPLNTNVSAQLRTALEEFKGPKSRISSLRRFGTKSRHCSGRAVDFEWNTELINYLVSPEGAAWREKFGVTFYIEGKPCTSCLQPYKKDVNYSKYVFENRNATGPHIHLNL